MKFQRQLKRRTKITKLLCPKHSICQCCSLQDGQCVLVTSSVTDWPKGTRKMACFWLSVYFYCDKGFFTSCNQLKQQHFLCFTAPIAWYCCLLSHHVTMAVNDSVELQNQNCHRNRNIKSYCQTARDFTAIISSC